MTSGSLIDRLKAKIDRRFNDLSAIVQRMDDDYGRYRMNKFVPNSAEGIKPEDAHTTNRDRVLADKVVFGIGAASRMIRVENDAAWQERQDANDNLERLAIGMLNIADKRQENIGLPPVQDQLSWYAANRGHYVVARALLLKNEQGETVPDVLPMDARNFVFERGQNGIIWGCYRTERRRSEIRADYPNFRFDDQPADDEGLDSDVMAMVYDYYERRGEDTWNGVFVGERWAKPFQNSFAVKFPIQVRAVGSMPRITNGGSSKDDPSVDFGESVYALNRRVTPILERVTSYNIAIIGQQVDRAYSGKSPEGNLSFQRNPLGKGEATTLGAQEEIVIHTPPTLDQSALLLRQTLDGEWQAGGLSAQALSGQPPPGGLSAAALRLLGSNLGERTRPFLLPVQSCLLGCLEAMIAQYETGRYKPLRVFGKTFTAATFDREIKPEDIEGHGLLGLELVLEKPEDDQLKWATAQLATTPNANGESLLSMQSAREMILRVQDSAIETSRQAVTRAKTQAPVLALLDMRQSAMRRGEQTMVNYLNSKIEETLMKEWMEQQALIFAFMRQMGVNPMQAAAAGMGGNGNSNGRAQQAAPPGLDPRVASVEQFMPGTTGAQPSPTAGANTTAPRPGAGNPDARLMEDIRFANIGLVRGR